MRIANVMKSLSGAYIIILTLLQIVLVRRLLNKCYDDESHVRQEIFPKSPALNELMKP